MGQVLEFVVSYFVDVSLLKSTPYLDMIFTRTSLAIHEDLGLVQYTVMDCTGRLILWSSTGTTVVRKCGVAVLELVTYWCTIQSGFGCMHFN